MPGSNASANGPLANQVRRIAHLDLPGAGQVYVSGDHCYVGHIPQKNGLGTTIVNVADPTDPKVVARIMLDDPDSHSHKVRVVGDLMIVNHEQNNRGIGRKAEEMHDARARLIDTLGRSYIDDLFKVVMSTEAAETAAPAISAMLIYIIMAVVLVFRPQGLFPPKVR